MQIAQISARRQRCTPNLIVESKCQFDEKKIQKKANNFNSGLTNKIIALVLLRADVMGPSYF